MKRTALLSVWDKTGLLSLAAKLLEADWELLATGGTARHLRDSGLQVTRVEQITGEPELFQGRVKTLHPAVHAGILAPDNEQARSQLRNKGWPRIDLVAVNLYPFQEVIQDLTSTRDQAIEHIDIGGSALLRAAAKNYQRVSVLCDPDDYPEDLSRIDDLVFREKMAGKTFAVTAAYDSAVCRYFQGKDHIPNPRTLVLYPGLTLRYGENPHQQASFYPDHPGGTPLGGLLLAGKALSYNNLLDLECAWRAVQRFQHPAVAVVKHASPCGIAEAASASQALSLAAATDPVSAFGSVIASSRPVNAEFVTALENLFVECLAAPEFSDRARSLLNERANVRLLQIPAGVLPPEEYRSLPGGFLAQTMDPGDPGRSSDWQVVTERSPSGRELESLRFAWKAVMDVKSNAVLLANARGEDHFTVGIGGGQPNRVNCVRLAGERAGARAEGSVLASDAFFPFPDGIQLAGRLGATAVVQPGGSIRDQEVIQEANRLGMVMVFTGTRHFRH